MVELSNAVKVKARKCVMGVVNPDHAVELHGEEFQNILIQLYGYLERRGLDYDVTLLPPRPSGQGPKPKGPAFPSQPPQPMYRMPWDNPIQPNPWDGGRYRMMAPESHVQGAAVAPGNSPMMGRMVPPEIQLTIAKQKDNKYRYPESKGLRLNHAGDWFLIPDELVEMGVSVFFGPLGMMANNYRLSGDKIRDTTTEMSADKYDEYGICRVDYVHGMSFQVVPTVDTDYEVGVAYPTDVFGKGDFDQAAVERLLALMRSYVHDHFAYLTASYMQNLMQHARFHTTNGIPHDLTTGYSRLADNYYVRTLACGTQREVVHIGHVDVHGQKFMASTSAIYPFTIDPSVEAFVVANLPYIMYTGSKQVRSN